MVYITRFSGGEEMSDIARHVGMRIKKIRKKKGLTIEDLGKRINKSKATISKYENGSVAIDLDTLADIAAALDVNLMTLVDFKLSDQPDTISREEIYFNRSKMYMYYFDGRTEQLVRALLCRVPPVEGENPAAIKVLMYQGIESFDVPEKAQHVFLGEMLAYDIITHVFMTNSVNKAEKLYLCIFNPLHANSPAIGMMSGFASNPFFGPIAVKIVVSNEPLVENEDLYKVTKLQPVEHRVFENLNMMALNRPNSLFLDIAEEKKTSEDSPGLL